MIAVTLTTLATVMTPYEWARVLINAGQLLAMIVIPLVVLKYKIKFTYGDTDEKDNK